MHIALIHHQFAAARKVRRVKALANTLEAVGHAVTLHDSASFLYPTDAPEAELLCICGGDGTARLVLDRQDDTAALPPLVIYPTGTINLLARELGYPACPQAFAARIAANCQPRGVTVGRAADRRFLVCASVGFDAYAVAAVSLGLKARIGRLAYIAGLVPMLWRWPRQKLQIIADGACISGEAIFVLRGAHYAGPWTLDRRAGLANAKLQVLVMPQARRRDFASLVIYALCGARRPRPEWHLLAVSTLRIEADKACPLQLDGDIAGSTPVSIGITNEVVRWL